MNSLASPSSVAYVMYQKYVDSLPLYRQEKDWEQLGIALSQATMANWIIQCSQDYLMPVTGHLRKKLLERHILHCGETPVQVSKENGKKPQTKSHMWLYRTGNDEKEPIILYDYQPSRNGDHAVAFLKNFKGFVHSDGYRMPSAHLLLVEKTVYLPIHQKEQMYRLQYTVSRRLHKRIISKYIPICNIYCFTCQIQTGVIIQKNWIICRLL